MWRNDDRQDRNPSGDDRQSPGHAPAPRGFVRAVGESVSGDMEILKDGERFDGKSVLSMLTLAAGQGTQLSLQASGPDAEDALTALDELVRQGFGEMNAAASSDPVATDENRQAG